MDVIKSFGDQRTIAIVVIVAFISIIFYLAGAKSAILFSPVYLGIMVMLFIGLAYITISSKMSNNEDSSGIALNYSTYFQFIGVLCVFLIIYMFTSTTNVMSYYLFGYITNIILFTIIAIGLAIVYYLSSNTLKQQEGIPGFIISLIFFIPCLIGDLTSYLLAEYASTPNIVFILFIAEVLVILLYICTPYIMRRVITHGGISLLPKPVYTSTSTIIGSKLINPVGDNIIALSTSSSFAISLWAFINNTQVAMNETLPIFQYNTPSSTIIRGPAIEYAGNDQWIFYVGEDGVGIPVTVPSQKWNNIVFNYYDNTADIFINNVLVKSVILNPMIAFLPTDTFRFGSDNGISGAMCNASFYNSPLNATQIERAYNDLQKRTPPVY